MIYKFKGFSLVEALLSLVIITLIFALSIPFLTKKALSYNEKLGRQSEGFYYEHSSDLNEIERRCYITRVSKDNITIIKDTGKCQKYEFIIPKKVHKIDLTLVAGGGGGGGASGGVEYSQSIKINDPEYQTTKTDFIKKLTIDSLIGKGTLAVNDGSTDKTGQGGNSGYSILNFDMPRDFLLKIKAIKKHNWYTNNSDNIFKLVINEMKRGLEMGDDSTKIRISDETAVAGVTTKDYYGGTYIRFGYDGTENKISYKHYLVAPNGNVGNTLTENNCTATDAPAENGGLKICSFLDSEIDYYNCDYYEDISSINSCTSDFCNLIPNAILYNSFKCKQGSSGTVVENADNYYNAYFKGGTGGFIPGYYQSYGSGQTGYGLVCNGVNCSRETTNTAVAGGQYGKATITYQYPGQVGKGGLGGSAVILRDFPVNPGSKYTIYVGAGGSGGNKGSFGKYQNGGSSETAGSNGLGGSSTAIYDENNQLVIMVIGGGGGFGGETVPLKDGYNRPITDNNYEYKINTDAPMQLPLIVYNRNNAGLHLYFDKKHHGSASFHNLSDDANSTSVDSSGGNFQTGDTFFVVEYQYNDDAYISKPAIPLLNRNNPAIYGEQTLPSTTDNRISSFANYAENIENTYAQLASSGSYMDTNLSGGYYSGFYYRYLIDDDFMFPGGLGSFSGIHSKTGCGGGFVGINQGYSMTAIAALGGGGVAYKLMKLANNALNSTFFASSNSTYTTRNIYRVDEYFDNCTINTPNGQSAKFIAPVISTVEGEAVGQAGAGGGGGGWSTKNGAGKGGDGQNGYVFITWRKR